MVTVSGTYFQGNNFKLSMGNGAVWNFTKIERSLLVFQPTNVSYTADEPVAYNLTILKNGVDVFSREFSTLGGLLSVELIPTDNATVVSGPDTNEPVVGAYHISGSFLKDSGTYTISAAITQVNDKAPDHQISDEFGVQIVPEFPVGMAVLPLLAGIGALAILARKYQLFGTKL